MKPFFLKILISLILVWPLLCYSQTETPSVLDSLITQLKSHPASDSIRAELLNITGFESYTSNLELTKQFAEELLALSNEIDYSKGIMNANNLFGIYHDYKGEYHQALKFYQLSLDIAEKTNRPSGISAGLNNLGMVHDILGNYPQALEYYQRSLKIDIQQNDYFGVANSYMNIGNLYESLNDDEKAMYYYQKGYHLSDSLKINKLISYSLLNIGYIHNKRHENDSARNYFHSSLDLSKKHQLQEGILLAYQMLGILEKEELNHQKAIQIFNNSLKLSIEQGYLAQERYCYFHIAEVYYNQKNYSKALEFLNLAYVDDEYSDENLRIDCVDLYTKIFEGKRDFKNAYKYHVKLKTLLDHSFSEDNLQKVANLEFQYKYDVEEKAREMEQQKKDALQQAHKERQKMLNNSLIAISTLLLIILLIILISYFQRRNTNQTLINQKQQLEKANELLRSQNIEIEKAAADLDIANQTKDKFFSIIAHDLRSPFNTILGFSNLLLESDEDFDKKSRELFLQKIKNGSESALILLENLFNWARSNSGNIKFNPETIDLAKTIKPISKLYENGAQSKNIGLKCNISTNEKIFADVEMFRTIIRNLVSNAIKFTPKHGEIEIFSSHTKNNSFIHIKDNGLGMNQDQLNKLFELNKNTIRKGTSGEKGTGLGLMLCYEFIKKHNGNIDVKSVEGKGTEVIVNFPNS